MSKSKKTVDERYQESIKEDEAQVAVEEAQRGDVSVTVNGDAVYVPQAPAAEAQAQTAEKPKESKAQRFKRLAARRLPKALKAIRQLETLASRAQYEYSDTQRAYVVAQLAGAIAAVKVAFDGRPVAAAAPDFPD